MPASIFIAKLLGPLFIVAGIALLSKMEMFREILRDFIGSPALVYIAGFFGLLGGLALVLTHNIWMRDWRVIVTLIGWATIVRALVTVFQPQWIVAAGRELLKHSRFFFAAAAMNLIIGLVLSYFGYIA